MRGTTFFPFRIRKRLVDRPAPHRPAETPRVERVGEKEPRSATRSSAPSADNQSFPRCSNSLRQLVSVATVPPQSFRVLSGHRLLLLSYRPRDAPGVVYVIIPRLARAP